jgi:putative flippase GtrA
MTQPAHSRAREVSRHVSELAAQLTRYGFVGVASNVLGYLVYLTITWLGVAPTVAMTMLYLVGATVSFVANRRWTFAHRGKAVWSGLRFGVAHVLGYLLNLSLLLAFVGMLGFPHQLVQAIAIGIVALFLFVAFRWFVFPHTRDGVAEAP